MNIQTSTTRKKYDRISKIYDLLEYPMEVGMGKNRAKLLGNLEGNILEIGVGTGKNLSYYSKNAKVTGIDLSEKMLSYAVRKSEKLGGSYNLQVMDAQNLNFKDNSFDYVVCTYVLCSIPNPVIALEEMKRVVKSDGEVLMLEHMLSANPVIAFFENVFNPITKGLIGFNINRDTIENINKSGLKIIEKKNFAMHDVFKKVVAVK